MKAKEMFEAIGYYGKESKDYILYEKKIGITTYNISFSLKLKEYACMFHNIGDYGKRLYIDIETHQAITQQMKELGWIE